MAEEENIVEQNSVESPLRRISRLTAPRRDAFGPGGAETAALALLNQQGGPQMLGFIGGLNADRLRAQDAYEQNLEAVNTQQGEIARRADETARIGQQALLARTFMQNPDAGSALQMLQPLLTPQGVQDARAFTTTRLGLRNSEIALNNARTLDALRGPTQARVTGSEAPLTPPQLIAVRDRVERSGDNAMREVIAQSRSPNTFTVSNGQVIPLPGTAPLTPAQIEAAQAAREVARQRARTELGALDPRFSRAMESMFGAPPAPTQAAPAQQTPAQTEAAPPQRAASPHAARVATARSNGWTDQQLRQQLAREGLSADEINAALAR
jgi:hypothetical protein